MASYVPGTSFYPCPWRASDIFKPEPAPPPTYSLKDHVRVVYNDSDWPTTPEGEEGISEGQGKPAYKPTIVAGNARTKPAMVSTRPLGLLSVKMREYSGKGEPGSGESDHGYILKEGLSAPPSRFLVHFFEILLILLAERPAPATRVDILQDKLPFLKPSKVGTLSCVDSRPPHTVLGAANANMMKKPADKPKGCTQVALKQTVEEKENLSLLSPDSDDGIDDSFLQVAGVHPPSGEGAGEQKKQSFMDIYLPNPFLDSDEEDDDLTLGERGGTRAEEEPNSDQDNFSFESVSSYPTVQVLSDGAVPKPCLHLPNARKRRHQAAWKDKLGQYNSYRYSSLNDLGSQICLMSNPGLSL